jgi:hypothetical protein
LGPVIAWNEKFKKSEKIYRRKNNYFDKKLGKIGGLMLQEMHDK